MTTPADRVFTNADVHTLAEPDETYEAVAVRDGRVVRVDSAYEVDFLVGAETDVVDCGGRTLLPGFVDAHTHMLQLGQYQVYADLSSAESAADAVAILDADAPRDREWLLGFGWDESEWAEKRYLTREDLDEVSDDEPVAAVRVDMHTAAVNSAALDALDVDPTDPNVRTADGEPTGVLVEDAVEPLWDAAEGDREEARELLAAARDYAHEHGVTAVHDMVRESPAPKLYRELDLADALDLRVRLNYWTDHLDALEDAGLATNHGSEFVQVGAVKSFTDGSFGGRTAKLTEPYADADAGGADGSGDADAADDGRGEWVVDPDELQGFVDRADDLGLQFTAHAIGDEAIDAVLDAYATAESPGDSRHRVEHVELVTDEQIERFAALDVVASCQPNFLQWAQPGGLYDQRLGEARRKQSNRYRDLLDAGVDLAFSSDVMPMDPMLGVHHAVNAPVDGQRLSVTEALRAYTRGGAYAGFDEDRMGTVEVGKLADFVVLDDDPWSVDASALRDVDVAMTVVDGDVVHDAR
ncbi:amidohydrolase [Halorubellus sp. JP-L1]|uniref:amidohydrolase n=1 Tax=Halorubellus sp. JP-L1 TaxID=2715753 RepID=UPI001409C3A6|nr:amidohydrolase [Halorubellus sp. JP-L1]NHN41218.1 amidohydrolase [Halorubellus sp. JP-L1]